MSLVASTSTKTVASTPNGKSGLASSISLPNLSFSTPTKQISGSGSNTPQKLGAPGRWQHPRLDEVIRRRNATNFDSSNIKAIGFNAALILTSLFIPRLLYQTLPAPLLETLHSYSLYLLYALRTFLLANIALSLFPLVRKPDACEDVPLTPSQRRLLGLPPMTRPATPAEQEQYVTPPRFARSAGTPRSASSSLFAEAGNSPASVRSGGGGGSPFATPGTSARGGARDAWAEAGAGSGYYSGGNGGSPFGGLGPQRRPGSGTERRLSFHSNRSSPLSISEFDAAGSVTTPTKGARASVGLNNKWLYEKGRGSPLVSPGRGSLFS